MRFPKAYNLESIAQIIDCDYIGDPNFQVLGSNEIHVVQSGEIVFVDHPKYYEKALNSNASVILINKEVACPEGKALLISDDPFRDFNKISTYFRPFQKSENLISPSAKIGEGTILQPNVIIGNNVTIGENCLIHANVIIYDNAIIGDNVIIHSGTVLGADAFYYKKRESFFDQLISCGRVIIEDNVTIGASCTIDKGVTGDTTIGEGSKLDNQIQIGHDTFIGKMCLIASQVGIAGCVVIKNNVTIWGQVGIASGLTIGEKVTILAQSGVSKSLEENKVYFGTPAEENREKLKQIAYLKRLTK